MIFFFNRQPEELPEALNVEEMEFNPKLKPPTKHVGGSSKKYGRVEAAFKPKTDYFSKTINLDEYLEGYGYNDCKDVKEEVTV